MHPESAKDRWPRAWGRRPGVRGAKGPTPAEVYDNLYKRWKPDSFDARAWVRVAKEAGQKYMIFLVKHHDGFCLYDTKLTDYRSTGPESAWKVDVMKEVADAQNAITNIIQEMETKGEIIISGRRGEEIIA